MKAEIKERIEMINRGEVPEGYKKTRIGIIPEDWEVITLGKLFRFNGGYPIPRNKLGEKGICYLHYGDIHTRNSNLIDVEKEKNALPKIAKTIDEINNNYLLDDGDIVFVDASEDLEGIGKSITILNMPSIPFVAGLHTIVAKDRKRILNKGFKRYFLSNYKVRKQFMFYATGVSVFGISRKNITKIEVGLPLFPEQEKIAQILSTWDKAIELKEKLIEEKKEQKKGLMQRLLTGEVRLPGFVGVWKEVRLKEVGKIITGTTPSTRKAEYYEDGTYPWITPTDIKENKYIYQSERYLTEAGIKVGRFLPAGSLLVTCIASIGKNAILTVDGSCNQQINAIITNENYQNEFLYYLIEFYVDYIKSYAGKSATEIINKNTFENLKFKIPSLQEQKAIAQVLSTADKEIELLEEELEQLKLQKKGLMQLLLTGIIRVKC